MKKNNKLRSVERVPCSVQRRDALWQQCMMGLSAFVMALPMAFVPLQAAAEDADMTFRVWKVLKEDLVKQSVYSVYHNIDKPMVSVLVEAELKGVEVDKLQLQKLSQFFEKN